MALIEEVEDVFLLKEIPCEKQFFISSSPTCDDYDLFFEAAKSSDANQNLSNLLHQELAFLSPISWKWALPYFLRYGLTPESEYSKSEIEFLVYALSPKDKFKEDAKVKLSLLTIEELKCLVSFVLSLKDSPFWSSYFPEDIQEAVVFLTSVLKRVSQKPAPDQNRLK